MSGLRATFERLRKEKSRGLVAYVTAGDPTPAGALCPEESEPQVQSHRPQKNALGTRADRRHVHRRAGLNV